MSKSKRTSARAIAKKEAVYEAAAEVFAQYGFRRTTMNDIAQAGGISRPALYLMFDNKENLFCDLAAYRLNQAVDRAISTLASEGSLNTRFVDALLIFEKVYYEPISDSPHGAELMDTNQKLATEEMMKGFAKLVNAFANVLKDAEQAGEASFQSSALTPKAFVELLFTALGGIKKKAKSTAEFRRNTEQLTLIFLKTIAV